MKIKLKVDLPLEKRHGATKGRVFEVLMNRDRYTFVGDSGEQCFAFSSEVEVINEESEK